MSEHSNNSTDSSTDNTSASKQALAAVKSLPALSKKIWPYVLRYKGWVSISLIFIIVRQIAALTEPYIFGQLIAAVEDMSSGVLSREQAITRSRWLMGGFILAQLTVIVSFAINLRFINKFQSHIMYDAAKDFVEHILNLSYRFHSDRKTGKISKEFARGVSAIETFMDAAIFNAVPLVLYLGSLLIIFARIDLWLTAIVIALVVSFCSFSVWSSFVMQRQRAQANTIDDESTGQAMDAFMNAESVLYFRQEKHESEQFSLLRGLWRTKKNEEWDGWVWIHSGQIAIVVTFLGIIVHYSMNEILHERLAIAHFVMVLTYITSVGHFLWEFQHHFRNVNEASTDLDAFFSYFDMENEIQETSDTLPLNVTKGEVQFANVAFGYKADDQVFNDISFTAEAGKTVALVGPSGAGKSTIMKLLWRFFDIANGTIHIDDQDISSVTLNSLRSKLSIVPQDTALFNTTVLKNIAYGCGKVTQEQVEAAARNAQVHDMIMRLPKGYDTLVGERGVKLSGGEKQRIAIARAFLRDAPILVLDEATSSLDSRSEAAIQKALTELMKGRTTLVIAHRLSTIMHADKIVVLDKGDGGSHVAQVGSHEELLEEGGLYEELWNQQVGGYIM